MIIFQIFLAKHASKHAKSAFSTRTYVHVCWILLPSRNFFHGDTHKPKLSEVLWNIIIIILYSLKALLLADNSFPFRNSIMGNQSSSEGRTFGRSGNSLGLSRSELEKRCQPSGWVNHAVRSWIQVSKIWIWRHDWGSRPIIWLRWPKKIKKELRNLSSYFALTRSLVLFVFSLDI